MNYSHEKTEIRRSLNKNQKDIDDLKRNRNHISNNTARFIVHAELYYNAYRDLELIISGVNKTNVNKRLNMIVDKIINQLIPSNMRYKFSSVKRELEQLSKSSGLDASKIKDKILTAVKNKIYNDILAEAEKMYKSTFFKIGNSHIKRAYSTGELAKWLRNKDSISKFKEFANKLSAASDIVDKLGNVINRSKQAIMVVEYYSQGKKLLRRQSKLKTSQDYREYYYKVAQEAARVAKGLKSLSGKLPVGMRDYYEFIFSVAENVDKMAKGVYNYASSLEKGSEELVKDVRKTQESPSTKAGDIYHLPNTKRTKNSTPGKLIDIFYGRK
jgi:hypothetical protein